MGAGSWTGAELVRSAAHAAPIERPKAAHVDTHALTGLADPWGPVKPLSPTRTGMGSALSPRHRRKPDDPIGHKMLSNYERTRPFCHISTASANLIFLFPIVEAASRRRLVVDPSRSGRDQKILNPVVDDPLFDDPLPRPADRGAVLRGDDRRLDDRGARARQSSPPSSPWRRARSSRHAKIRRSGLQASRPAPKAHRLACGWPLRCRS